MAASSEGIVKGVTVLPKYLRYGRTNMRLLAIAALILGAVLALMLWIVSLIPTAILAFVGAALLVVLPLVGVCFGFLVLFAQAMQS